MNSIVAVNPSEEYAGFWKRQFADSATIQQVVFDVVFGVLMPLLCFYLDPGIIGGGFGTPLREVNLFVYCFSALAIVTLATWLIFGYRLQSLSAFVGGVLLAGAVCSFSIAVIILPLTLLGLLFVIGVLGFVPFITGFVYLRNGLRAVRLRASRTSQASRFSVVALSGLMALGLPAFAQWKVIDIMNQSMLEIENPDGGPLDAPVKRIKRIRLFVDADRMVRAYENEADAASKARLNEAYKEITGSSIEERLRKLRD